MRNRNKEIYVTFEVAEVVEKYGCKMQGGKATLRESAVVEKPLNFNTVTLNHNLKKLFIQT